MIEILQLPLGPLQTNCYMLVCEETLDTAVIDPSWNGRALAATLDERGYNLTHILLTHSHFDHVAGLAELKAEKPAPIYIHPDAIPTLRDATMSAALWNIRFPSPPPPDEMLDAGQILQIGRLAVHVLFTPGHAPGHVSFYLPEHKVVFDGDVLFQQSIGRTDLPGGDYDLLLRSIREQLLTLPDETQVLPGHGPATTIGAEKQTNPFLNP
ncbi:MAG: MBL fold metallo-hydrolase [Ardenticatenaceae bacterium]|nr:MBL fold metallo-hydrolase [Ardenticatenaceae bacterium]